jgi:hypothetical protein
MAQAQAGGDGMTEIPTEAIHAAGRVIGAYRPEAQGSGGLSARSLAQAALEAAAPHIAAAERARIRQLVMDMARELVAQNCRVDVLQRVWDLADLLAGDQP